MGCGISISTTPETSTRVVILASDSGSCRMPKRVKIPGDKQSVPEQLQKCFTLEEWLSIVSQLERIVNTDGRRCLGPDPLFGPGAALVNSLNATYSGQRGVVFSFSSQAWHPDRRGQQFHREFIVEAGVGSVEASYAENR
eukprot:gene25607-9146_t